VLVGVALGSPRTGVFVAVGVSVGVGVGLGVTGSPQTATIRLYGPVTCLRTEA
jgi:hypothetical protein